MSFLEHLDELHKRLVSSVLILVVSFCVCFYFSEPIYDFLSVPIRQALSEASRRNLPIKGITGLETVSPIANLQEGHTGRYIFNEPTRLDPTLITAGTSVLAQVSRDSGGILGLFTTEPLITNNAVIPAGVRLPIKFEATAIGEANRDEQMMVTTALEPFTLYMTVSFYSAIALALPLLLWQLWMFISPALYKHERKYVTPFIGLSSISFVLGVAFAYYILFPPAARYLLGVGQGFKLLLKASDYLDFITLIMLAMGLIFQMPAITYVLSRIGLVTAGLMLRSWKLALIVILIIAAVVSPTADILNMMLFATPMMGLYMVTIFIAWLFGRRRKSDAEIAAT